MLLTVFERVIYFNRFLRRRLRPRLKYSAVPLIAATLVSCGSAQEGSSRPSAIDDPRIIGLYKETISGNVESLTTEAGVPVYLPAAQRFKVKIDFPIDKTVANIKEQSPDLTQNYSANVGAAYVQSDKDNFGIAKNQYANIEAESCPVTFAALRSSFRIDKPTEKLASNTYGPNDMWICTDAIAYPGLRGHRCGTLIDNHLVGRVTRFCLQRTDLSKRISRTIPMGLYRCPSENPESCGSYSDRLISSSKVIAEARAEHTASANAAYADLRENFRKSEVAYKKFWDSTPMTPEGRQALVKNVAFATFASITGDLELPLWKDFLMKTLATSTISAVTEVMNSKEYREAATESLQKAAVGKPLDKTISAGFVAFVAKQKGINAADVKISGPTGDILGALGSIIGGLAVDYYQGELEPGVYAKDSSMAEDVAERLVMAALNVLTYNVAGKIGGPLGGVLLSEMQTLYYEVVALGRYGYFLNQSAKLEKIEQDRLNARAMSGYLDRDVAEISYRLYLDQVMKAI